MTSLESYRQLLAGKRLQSQLAGFEPPELSDGLFPHQRHGVEFALRLGRAAIFYDCVAGETLIETNTGPIRIDALAARGLPIIVYSLGEDGEIRSSPANAPFKKGRARLYEVKTALGRSISVTAGHRFLSDRGWLSCSELQPGERLLVSDAYHPPSTSESSLSALLADGRRSSQTSEGCSACCCPSCALRQPYSDTQSAVFRFSPWSSPCCDTVVSIQYLRTDYYYDLHVPGDENYLAHGFWNHNTGLGKTSIALEWAKHVARHANTKVLMLCPLAVAAQHAREAERVGVSARVIRGNPASWEQDVYICNYDRLEKLDLSAFGAVILDESSILKSFAGKTKTKIIESFKRTPYRLACTATPAPNDHMELGNHAEFLSVMQSREMLSRFFINDTSVASQSWRLKGHAHESFWDWVASWARMCGKPSDLGFSDDGFLLPDLNIHRHVLAADIETDTDGYLFRMPMMSATGLHKEKRLTLAMRADEIARIVHLEPAEPWILWCDTNYEAAALKARIPDAYEVAGSMDIDRKERLLNAFSNGEIRILLSKPSVCGWGVNWQHCARMAFVGLNYCFDEDTEILTRRGWRSFGEVTTDDEVAAVTTPELEMRWERPTAVTWEHYDGDMVRFGGQRSFDLLVTPNHRMLVKRCDVRYGDNRGEWHFREAGELATNWKRQEYRLPSIPREWRGAPLERMHIPLPDGFRWSSRSRVVGDLTARQVAILAGWYVSEGYVRQENTIVISQSDIHPGNRAEIIELLESLGLRVGSKTKDIYACSRQLAQWLANEFGTNSYNMRIPRWLLDADTATLTLLRDTMIKGDGCHSGGRIAAYRSYSAELRDNFQEMCLKTGMKASVKPDWGGVMLGHKHFEPSISIRPIVEQYEGMIGCVSVPSGSILVRRNGIPVITGNSYESFYQAVRRCWRFKQTRAVDVHTAVADTELEIIKRLTRKQTDHETSKKEMAAAMARACLHAETKTEYRPRVAVQLPEWVG